MNRAFLLPSLIVILLATALLSACGTASPTATPTSAPTSTVPPATATVPRPTATMAAAAATAAPTLAATAASSTGATPAAGATPDQATFASYFSALTLGKIPLTAAASSATPTPTNTFSFGTDQICIVYTVVKPVQIATGLYDVSKSVWLVPKTLIPQTIQPGSSSICAPAGPPDKYEMDVWVGDTLVASLPFTVQ